MPTGNQLADLRPLHERFNFQPIHSGQVRPSKNIENSKFNQTVPHIGISFE